MTAANDLIIGMFLSQIDAALARLEDPDDAVRCIPDLVLGPNSFIEGSPVNEALFSAGR